MHGDPSAGADKALPRVQVPDHLARCLLAAVLCPPLGWLAVRHSLRVNHRLQAFDQDGADRERRRALGWYRISFLALLGGGLLLLALRLQELRAALGA
jgi:hypothetical protein